MTASSGICVDLGPCGTCTSELSLDGVIRLRGPDGGSELCDAFLGCSELTDSCLPTWACEPFPIGRRVAVEGTVRFMDAAVEDVPFSRFLQRYTLEVETMEVVEEPTLLDGRYAGTITMFEAIGPDCGIVGPLPEEDQAIEFVLAYNSTEGALVEFMAPGNDMLPISSGWHVGTMAPGSACISVEAGFGFGQFMACPNGTGYEGMYTMSFSGPDCSIVSTLQTEQVY